MSDTNEPKARTLDHIKVSEITAILQEERFLTPEVLPPDITYGQARGIAGRKRTQAMRRLKELGFIEGPPSIGTGSVPPGTATIDCFFGWFIVPFVFCKVSVSL